MLNRLHRSVSLSTWHGDLMVRRKRPPHPLPELRGVSARSSLSSECMRHARAHARLVDLRIMIHGGTHGAGSIFHMSRIFTRADDPLGLAELRPFSFIFCLTCMCHDHHNCRRHDPCLAQMRHSFHAWCVCLGGDIADDDDNTGHMRRCTLGDIFASPTFRIFQGQPYNPPTITITVSRQQQEPTGIWHGSSTPPRQLHSSGSDPGLGVSILHRDIISATILT